MEHKNIILPNFLIIGMAKSGTTSLYHYLTQHPEVFMTPIKEPHFFAHGDVANYSFDGPKKSREYVKCWPEYLQLFSKLSNEIAIGEASNSNVQPRACNRIYQHISGVKLIAIIRQPADRIYSQFLHARRLGWERYTTLSLALHDESVGIRENWHPYLCYKQNAFIYDNLKNFYTIFNKKQIRIYIYENWEIQPLTILNFSFTGVDLTFTPDISTRYNVASLSHNQWLFSFTRNSPSYIRNMAKIIISKNIRTKSIKILSTLNKSEELSPIDPELRKEITKMYRDNILRTQELIAQDLLHWLQC